MKEIRLHGRGGHGTVTAAEIIVWTQVQQGNFGTAVPYFGFEKKGGPVSAFVRLDDRPVRQKTQVYHPDCIVVIDPTLMRSVNVFNGAKAGSTLVINYKNSLPPEMIPGQIETIAYVDATKIALDTIGRDIPNTVMLGAFARATGWVDIELMKQRVGEIFGEKNITACEKGYKETKVIKAKEVTVS